jgi:predicted nucleotidyltransferase
MDAFELIAEQQKQIDALRKELDNCRERKRERDEAASNFARDYLAERQQISNLLAALTYAMNALPPDEAAYIKQLSSGDMPAARESETT